MATGPWTNTNTNDRELAAMAEEDRQRGMRQLVSQMLGQKVDSSVASLIARFLNYRCMICDERPGVFTKIGNICEWRCMTCALALLPDDTWGHRSIHNHPGSPPAGGHSEGVSSSESSALSEVLAQSISLSEIWTQGVSSSQSSALSEVTISCNDASLRTATEHTDARRTATEHSYLLIGLGAPQ